MDVFKKPKFPPPPANYQPGIARGAVPFFTRSDIGSAASPGSIIKYLLCSPTKGTRGHEHATDKGDYSDTLFDKWSGFSDKPFASDKYDNEDSEADRIYSEIDSYIDGRRKEKREQTLYKMLEKNAPQTVGKMFADTKKDLATMTRGKFVILT